MISDKLYKQADLVVLFSKSRISLQVLANGFFSAEKIRKAIMHQVRKYENEDYTDFVYDLNKKIYCPLYLGRNHFLTFEITKDDEIYDIEKTSHDDCKAVIELKLSKFDYTVTVLTYTENCYFEPVFKFYHQD